MNLFFFIHFYMKIKLMVRKKIWKFTEIYELHIHCQTFSKDFWIHQTFIMLSLCGTQLTKRWSWSRDRRLGSTWRWTVSSFPSQSVSVFIVCVGEAASLQPTVCMLEIWERNQPAASNTEQLSVSWVTQAYCLLATVKCTAGPTLANNTLTHTRAHTHTNTHALTVSISPMLSHQTTTRP